MAKTEALTRQQIELSIKKKEFFPIYVLSGEEPFYVDKLSEMIIDNALTEEEKDFNLSVYYASDTRMADVALACRRYPMMAERQVVVLREAQAWKSMNGVNEKKELEILESYAEKPTASTVLVVCYKGATLKSPNLTKILAKTMPDGRKAGIYFESKKIPEYSIGSNISEYVRSVDCTIDDKALAMLTEYLGNDMSRIVKEIDKLKMISSGCAAFTRKGRDLVPHPDLALNIRFRKEACPAAETDRNTALKFLHRDAVTLPGAEKGFVLVCHEGVPLGFVKNLGSRCNNLHPQERRIRMDI